MKKRFYPTATLDRFSNPFKPKAGKDTYPGFEPSPHYLQVKSLCNEACFRVYTNSPIVFDLKELKIIIDNYKDLFDETEVWIALYIAFDEFSHLYLTICENMVFIEDYGKLCQKAISEFHIMELSAWLEKYRKDYEIVNDKLEWHSECDCKDDRIMKINFSVVHVYRKEIEAHISFHQLYKDNKSDINE